jgi:predicted RNase H-like nuclease
MSMSGLHRGADLPYKLLAGVEACPGGWLVIVGRLQGISLFPTRPEVFKTFIEVLDYKPAFTTVALHMPVGLPSEPAPHGRTCDQEARKVLGRHRGTAVQSPPCRPVLSAQTYDEARELNGGKLDIVTWRRMRWYREVNAEMASYWQRVIYEVNPELTFLELNDGLPLQFSKRSQLGVKERRALLERRMQGADRILDSRVHGARQQHIVDALANLWAARKITSKAVTRLPEIPEWDDEGLRMEILR